MVTSSSRIDSVALLLVLQHLVVLVGLLASWAEYFENLKHFFNFKMNVFWRLLSLAHRFGTHPDHGCVNARFTKQRVTRDALHRVGRILIAHR